MKPAIFGTCAVAYSLFLSCAFAQGPTLLTPGTSTETVEVIGTGTKTTFSMTGNTILSWDQLNLAAGSELVYDFVQGDRVLNLLSGSNRHAINGTVTSNGVVGFFSPNANFEINGSITAKGVVLSALETDADDFFSEDGYTLGGGSGANLLMVGGEIRATDGDVVLAGPSVMVDMKGDVVASGAVRVGAGSELTVSGSGQKRMGVRSDSGDILHMGSIRGSTVEMKAGGSVENEGLVDAGVGQVFIEVGQDMQITNSSNGVIIGESVFTNETVTTGLVILTDEGDSAPGVSQGTLNVPALTRPDGTQVSVRQQVSASAPVSASGDIGRDVARADTRSSRRNGNPVTASGSGSREVASNQRGTRSLLRRSSFFGVRGGSKNTPER